MIGAAQLRRKIPWRANLGNNLRVHEWGLEGNDGIVRFEGWFSPHVETNSWWLISYLVPVSREAETPSHGARNHGSRWPFQISRWVFLRFELSLFHPWKWVRECGDGTWWPYLFPPSPKVNLITTCGSWGKGNWTRKDYQGSLLRSQNVHAQAFLCSWGLADEAWQMRLGWRPTSHFSAVGSRIS
jgi:hypothetical protein